MNLDREQQVIVCFLEDGPKNRSVIRRHLYLIHCSETRPAETRRQIEALIAEGLVETISRGVYQLTAKGRRFIVVSGLSKPTAEDLLDLNENVGQRPCQLLWPNGQDYALLYDLASNPPG